MNESFTLTGRTAEPYRLEGKGVENRRFASKNGERQCKGLAMRRRLLGKIRMNSLVNYAITTGLYIHVG